MFDMKLSDEGRPISNRLLGQEWVTKVTNSDEPEPPVMGCGGKEQAWKDSYIARCIERGWDPRDAQLFADAENHDYDSNPKDAADDDMECCEFDGDLA